MTQAEVALVSTGGQATVVASYSDGSDLGLGDGSPAKFRWETADANANALILELPTPGAFDVPVFIIGTAEATAPLDADLGLFNGVTETTLAIQDSDGDTHLVLDFSADDAARIRTIGTTRDLTVAPTGNLILENVSALTVTGAVLANADDGGALGASGTGWSDLFLASGAVVNFNAGDVTLTHAAGQVSLSSGNLFLGDTSNAKMTQGVTLNQGANDDEILAFKSSDIAHGATSFGETDTWGLFLKESGDDGGMRVRGVSEATIGLRLSAIAATNDTTKTTSGRGGVDIETRKIAGVGSGDNDADANLVVIRALDNTRFIFDNEGSAHGDVEWTTFDTEDDIVMLRDLEAEMLPGRFGKSLQYNRSDFERLGVVGKDSWHREGQREHAMINWTRLAMVHHGAIQQVYDRLTERVDQLTQALSGAGIPLPEGK